MHLWCIPATVTNYPSKDNCTTSDDPVPMCYFIAGGTKAPMFWTTVGWASGQAGIWSFVWCINAGIDIGKQNFSFVYNSKNLKGSRTLTTNYLDIILKADTTYLCSCKTGYKQYPPNTYFDLYTRSFWQPEN